MTPSLFQRGDIVVRPNRRDERGTIIGPARAIVGRNYYKILFPSSATPLQVAESDLDAVKLEMSPEDLLLDGEFGDKSTFSRLLTYERLQHSLQDTLYSLRERANPQPKGSRPFGPHGLRSSPRVRRFPRSADRQSWQP